MPHQSVATTLTRTITVARGIVAPGHLEELTQYLPFELVDDILIQTRTMQRRTRLLPSRVSVYFVLALAVFPTLGCERVWDKLVAGLGSLSLRRPSEKALRDLRRRLGAAPLKALFEIAAGPLAKLVLRGCDIGVGALWLSTAAVRSKLPISRGSGSDWANWRDTVVAPKATRIYGC